MNILIKLTCLIGLVIAPILGEHTEEGVASLNENIEVREMNTVEISDLSKAASEMSATKKVTENSYIINNKSSETLDKVNIKANEYAKLQKNN